MQQKLALRSPDDHGERLHPGPRHGTVLVWLRLVGGRWVKVDPQDNMGLVLSGQRGGTDRFISVNEFHSWRLVRLLKTLRACYVDLDGCTDWRVALDLCDQLGLPPSYLVTSGRGVHLYWLMEATPGRALPVWQAVQRKLIALFSALGADPACADSTRVLRLVGTVNSKTGTEVLGYLITPGYWTLHDLADRVLGERPARGVVTSLTKARSARAVHQATGTFRLWHSRYVDLCTIADYHGFMRPQGIPEGSRDAMLFLLADSLSWFTRSDTLAAEIAGVARVYVPTLSEREVKTYTQPILQRAVMAAEGKTIEWEGKQVDPRYRFRTSTIRDWLGELLVPELESRLKVLLPQGVLDERERERLRKRDGVKQGRAEYLAQFEDSQNAQQPWEALGITRRAYFYRKAKGVL